MFRQMLPIVIVLGIGLFFGAELFDSAHHAKGAALSLFERGSEAPAASAEELVERVVAAIADDEATGIAALYPTEQEEIGEPCIARLGPVSVADETGEAVSSCHALLGGGGVARIRMKGGSRKRKRRQCPRTHALRDIQARVRTDAGDLRVTLAGAFVHRGRYYLTRPPVCRSARSLP